MTDATIINAGQRSRGTASAAVILLGLAALGAAGCTSTDADSSAVPSSAGRVTMTSFAPLVSEIIPAVVNVSAHPEVS